MKADSNRAHARPRAARPSSSLQSSPFHPQNRTLRNCSDGGADRLCWQRHLKDQRPRRLCNYAIHSLSLQSDRTHAQTALSLFLHNPNLLLQVVVEQLFSPAYTTLFQFWASHCNQNWQHSQRSQNKVQTVLSSRTSQSAITPSPWTTKRT